MVEINKHKFFLVQLLKDIYSDLSLANLLGFKGGTALMLFHDLPRFSVDLDFNLLDNSKTDFVFGKIRNIVLNYGKIRDEAKKHYGMIIVLDYGQAERNLKIEISNRDFGDHYEVRNYLGIPVRIMQLPDMFAHKLCALLDRNVLASRDIFDCHYLMQKRTPLNRQIVEKRMKTDLVDYLQRCIDVVEKMNEKRMLSGLGDLMDEETKKFVKTRLKQDTITLLRMYREFPVLK
ncbi:MAG: nucleotidyl transferase AbiEii/AbiGii toxin family protein [Bacteroidetes bacterium]|nr:MAG: nucleotidyl transferase AbiEii/AbiGii toxin family protein [Bacteroidota bacterium]